MPFGKGVPTVLVTTHLPADFQGDVKSDTGLDSPLFPHTPTVSKNRLPLPCFWLERMQHTNPLLKANPSSVVHRSWVWTHRYFSHSKMRSSISAVVETAKTALHCKSALLQDCWKALRGT